MCGGVIVAPHVLRMVARFQCVAVGVMPCDVGMVVLFMVFPSAVALVHVVDMVMCV